jgi:hypothetical protein
MPSTVQGTRGTASILQNRQVIDISHTIHLLEPSSYPLVTLLNSLDKIKPAHNPTVRWMEDELEPLTDLVNGAIAANIAAVVVDNGGWWRVNDIGHVPRTGENFRVTAVAGNTLTVVRSFGATAAANIVDDEPIWNLGPAQREGDTSRALLSTLEVEQSNRTQIVRTPFGTTNTQSATDLYDGNDLDYQAQKSAIEHAVRLERFLIFGQNATATVAGQPLRTMSGILEYVQTNRRDVNGILTEAEFDAFCETGFRYGGTNQKLLIASGRVIQAINNFSKEKMETVPRDESYGLNLQRYISPFGDLLLSYHRQLVGSIYSGYGIMLDMDRVVLRPLRGGRSAGSLAVRVTNIQANDEDSRRDEYLTECSLEFQNEKAHALLTGVEG